MNSPLKFVPVCHLVLVTPDSKKLLMLLRKNTGYYDNMYCLVAGRAETNETIINGMIREALEEANITLRSEDLKVSSTMYRNAGDKIAIDFFILANKWDGEIKNNEPDKCADLCFFEIDKLPDNIPPFVLSGVKAALKGINYLEYGWNT